MLVFLKIILTKLQSVCITDKCKQLVFGLIDLAPFRNIGCTGLANGLANGVVYDTNDVEKHVLTDYVNFKMVHFMVTSKLRSISFFYIFNFILKNRI